MEIPENFRTAFHGFRREDVVKYLEYMTSKHQSQVNQLEQELEQLRLQVCDGTEQMSALRAQCDQLRQQLAQAQGEKEQLCQTCQKVEGLRGENEALAQKCQAMEQAHGELLEHCQALEALLTEEAPAQEEPEEEPQELSQQALEHYRRAERTEREARDRAELTYFQTNSVLQEAGARIDAVSAQITQAADEAMRQLTQLQMAVSGSKQALQDAAAIVGTIRPNP